MIPGVEDSIYLSHLCSWHISKTMKDYPLKKNDRTGSASDPLLSPGAEYPELSQCPRENRLESWPICGGLVFLNNHIVSKVTGVFCSPLIAGQELLSMSVSSFSWSPRTQAFFLPVVSPSLDGKPFLACTWLLLILQYHDFSSMKINLIHTELPLSGSWFGWEPSGGETTAEPPKWEGLRRRV